FCVFDGNLKILLDEADQIRAFENRRAIQKRLEFRNFDEITACHADILEYDFRELLPGHRPESCDSDAVSSGRYRPGNEAIPVSRDYPDKIGHLCIGNEELRSIKDRFAIRAPRLKRDIISAPATHTLGKGVCMDL